MVRGIENRLPLIGGIALAAIVVWQARRVEAPMVVLPPSDGTVESIRRQAFAFLHVPERVLPQLATLRGLKFEAVPGPAPVAKEIATHDPSQPRRDPFFPAWYAPETAAIAAVDGAAIDDRSSTQKKPPIARSLATRAKPGGKLVAADDRQCQFSGTILLQSGKPAAVVKDLTSGENVLLSEGESYRGVLLAQIDFFTATFASPTGAIYRFSTVVGGDKTFPTGEGVAARERATDAGDSPGGGVVERDHRNE
ncbi:MAG: hypothetical protein HYR85_27630 [Planctomycetes bacterium]|nr:hypothetical protein [Planctomycetota bacterium]MBI3844248.1 hypothetical protein [Planctomycetota bacterium]